MINRSPTRSVPNTTPIEAWSGFKPNVQHLKVFGSIAYAHVPKAARSKLDDRAVKTIFIGYKNGGYKLYNPMTKKVILSRDVTFAEHEAWKWNTTAEMNSKTRYVYVLNEDAAPVAEPEAVVPEIESEGATPANELEVATRPRRERRQPVHL